MPEPLGFIDDREEEAMKKLLVELQLPLALARDAYQLVLAAVAQVPSQPVLEMPLAMRVCMGLLIRIADDVRMTGVAAMRGYPAQAATLTTPIFETAFRIAYIGSSEERAEEWVDHDDPIRLPPPATVKALVEKVVEERSEPVDLATRYRKTYAQLCWAKHVSPLLQKVLNLQPSAAGEVELLAGPDTSEHGGFPLARWSLTPAAGCGGPGVEPAGRRARAGPAAFATTKAAGRPVRAAPHRERDCLLLTYLRRIAARPARPRPINSAVPGSGTTWKSA